MSGLRALGVDVLVSALTEREGAHLGLVTEPVVARSHGLAYREFPIADFGVPDPGALAGLASELADEVGDGRYVVVHCRAGVGRTGLIVGATLIAMGASTEQALDLMRTARGRRSPETRGQVAMLRSLTSR